jgi:ubiquinone/menaquinone biosynthesis C-methylase UbiE
MNPIEHFFCSSSLWRYFSERHLLPWVLAGNDLGEHTLEIGAGYGAATRYLRERAERVTALESHRGSLLRFMEQHQADGIGLVCGDGTQLPFAAETFTSAVAILVLHHLTSAELQDRMLGEVLRVLRPGGAFAGLEITAGWVNRLAHIGSTFTPFSPEAAVGRLAAAGFAKISVDLRSGAFRFCAGKAGAEAGCRG